MQTLPNIDYSKLKTQPTIDSESDVYELPFFKDSEYFATQLENFVGFVKAVERQVRSSKYYARYRAYLREDLGLNYCQVMPNVSEEDSITIEMHHGPILTLFDCAAIITDHLIATGDTRITTFKVASILMKEHFENNIQVVMLSQTTHEMTHTNDIFISMKQGFGDINTFLNRYRAGINVQQIARINQYIRLSTENESFDNGTLDLYKTVRKWARENE